MNKIIEIVKELRGTNATKEKQIILERNKDNEMLQKILRYTYNPHKRYGISEKTFTDFDGANVELNCELFGLLDICARSNINDSLKNQVVAYVRSYSLNPNMVDIMKGIFCKDLKIGIQASTINKVWKDLIPVFDVQLATSIEKIKPENLEGQWMYVTEKFDGIRCVCIIKNEDDIKFFSRNGKEMLGLNDLRQSVKSFKIKNKIQDNIVFDGELLKFNDNGLNSGDLYRETVSIVNSKMEDKKMIEFHVFDVLTLREFENGISDVTYRYRRALLNMLLEDEFVIIAPVIHQGTDLNEIMAIGQEFINSGKEGIMINIDKKYECKRVKHLIKVKGINSADLEVVDIVEGTGRLKGKLGAVICKYKDGQTVNVGSGFSDEERLEMWKTKDSNISMIGNIIEVRYTEESKDKNGSYSLRFPRFISTRWDKDEADY